MSTEKVPNLSVPTLPRAHLLRALETDLIGPFEFREDSEEELYIPPSRWYLTGFLAPLAARDSEDPTGKEELGAGPDEEEEETAGQEPEPKQKHRLPASMGLTVLLPPGKKIVSMLPSPSRTMSRQSVK